ncbi:MAG: hypothetical protein ABJF11_19920 [Reichenbachiella sp.]|uniref:hypothetical protein n=1 Tax=Reichenbachiella sp. TaxID=2184521 RepID=UPI0032633983
MKITNCRASTQGMRQTLEKKRPEERKNERKKNILIYRVNLRSEGKRQANRSTEYPPGSGNSFWYE